MAISPIAHVVNEIKKAELTDAALYWFAFKFINEKCKQGSLCKNFPPNGACDVADCVHEFMKANLGIDIPMIQPRKKKEDDSNGPGKTK